MAFVVLLHWFTCPFVPHGCSPYVWLLGSAGTRVPHWHAAPSLEVVPPLHRRVPAGVVARAHDENLPQVVKSMPRPPPPPPPPPTAGAAGTSKASGTSRLLRTVQAGGALATLAARAVRAATRAPLSPAAQLQGLAQVHAPLSADAASTSQHAADACRGWAAAAAACGWPAALAAGCENGA